MYKFVPMIITLAVGRTNFFEKTVGLVRTASMMLLWKRSRRALRPRGSWLG